MRLKKEFVEKISKKIIESLINKDLIIWESSPDKLELIINKEFFSHHKIYYTDHKLRVNSYSYFYIK